MEGDPEPLTINLWDFGGQEIYHATHRLFLADDSVYLLLWAEDTEEHPDETRHPVSYWLDAIHDLARKSPIILVKNQIDRSDKLLECPEGLRDDLPGVRQIRHAVRIAAKPYRNLPALRGALASVLEELKPRLCWELPTSWVRVEEELAALRNEHRTIPFAQFEQLCAKYGVSSAEWFADYLHRTGIIFYQPGNFQDQVILDQNWFINEVYRIFDPKLPHRRHISRMGGRFSGEDAALIWPEADPTDRETYLAFMHNSGICYEPQRWKRWRKPLQEHEFIIPALLPEDHSVRCAWRPQTGDWELRVDFSFLHRSIIERLILRLGETYGGEPWRTGIYCRTELGEVLLECQYLDRQVSAQGTLHFHLRGSQLKELLYAIRKLLADTSPHRRYEEWLVRNAAEQKLQPFEEQKDAPRSELDAHADTAPPRVKVFISYSHQDDEHRKALETQLKGLGRRLPITYWSDKTLQLGGMVDEDILRQLQTADIVLLLVSPDFVASTNVYDKEAQEVLQRYEQGGKTVIPIIVRTTPKWQELPLGKLTALPHGGKPLEDWPSKDKFWEAVILGLEIAITTHLQRAKQDDESN